MSTMAVSQRSHSMRRRLLGSVMTAILLAGLFQAVSAYRGALRQADTMFDYHLQQMAFALRGRPALAVPMLEWDLNNDVDYVIQIWGADGAQLFRSNRLALPSRAVLGFSDLTQGGIRYRVCSVQTPWQTIQIAQDMDGREARARARRTCGIAHGHHCTAADVEPVVGDTALAEPAGAYPQPGCHARHGRSLAAAGG